MNERLLSIYLNDHLGGAMLGREMTERCLGHNRGTPLGEFLERLLGEIEEDRHSLEEVVARLHLRRDRMKPAIGWASEKLARLKPNGAFPLIGLSTLDTFELLEQISTGIEAKRMMWIALAELAGQDQRIHRPEMERLRARAEAQREDLEPFRLEAARRSMA